MPLFRIEDADLLTPEALVIMRARRRRHRRLAGAALAVAVTGALTARPLFHAAKGWQARRLAAESLAYSASQRWRPAYDRAADACALSPQEPVALRAMARLLARTRHTEALSYYHRLQDLNALTLDDRREFAASALTLSAPDDAAEQCAWLLSHDRSAPGARVPPDDLLLTAQVAAVRGDETAALDVSRRLLAEPAADETGRFTAAVRLVNAAAIHGDPNGDAARPAWECIRHLANSRGAVGLQALTLLSRRPTPAPHEPTPPGWMDPADIARALDTHPLARVPDQLLVLDLTTGADPTARAADLDTAVTRWRGGDDASLDALASWLAGKGAAARVLEILPATRTNRNATLFSHRLNALAMLGRWDALKTELSGDNPLDPVAQHMYLASTDTRLGDPHAATSEWHLALGLAGRDANQLYPLGTYAEQAGATEAAEAAYAAAITVAPTMRPAHEALIRITDEHGQTATAAAAMAGMLEVWPADEEAKNSEGYLRLLLGTSGTEAESIGRTAAALALREPSNWRARATLALARLHAGQSTEALRAFAGLHASHDGSVPPGALAVRAAAMAAAGWKDEARADARALATARLLPEERALIAPLITD